MTAMVIALHPVAVQQQEQPKDPIASVFALIREAYEPMLGIAVSPLIEAVERVKEYVELLESQAVDTERERRDLIEELGRTEELLQEASWH